MSRFCPTCGNAREMVIGFFGVCHRCDHGPCPDSERTEPGTRRLWLPFGGMLDVILLEYIVIPGKVPEDTALPGAVFYDSKDLGSWSNWYWFDVPVRHVACHKGQFYVHPGAEIYDSNHPDFKRAK